mmetsp:Transcript_28611/g.63610  ORF Transcript_28611/g.63610 Transcript_28611/m.63610 type:complete len:130 (-) Transcript_28611:180-569(-)
MLPSDQTLEPGLVRKLLLRRHPDQRYGNDTIVAATELLRLFIVEARQRAAIEAECEAETKDVGKDGASLSQMSMPSLPPSESSDDDIMEDGGGRSGRKKRNAYSADCATTSIRPDHIARVAAELLMDFS